MAAGCEALPVPWENVSPVGRECPSLGPWPPRVLTLGTTRRTVTWGGPSFWGSGDVIGVYDRPVCHSPSYEVPQRSKATGRSLPAVPPRSPGNTHSADHKNQRIYSMKGR